MKYYFETELNKFGISEYVETDTKKEAIEQLIKVYGISKYKAKELLKYK